MVPLVLDDGIADRKVVVDVCRVPDVRIQRSRIWPRSPERHAPVFFIRWRNVVPVLDYWAIRGIEGVNPGIQCQAFHRKTTGRRSVHYRTCAVEAECVLDFS